MKTLTDLRAARPKQIFEHVYAANYDWMIRYVLRNSGTEDEARDIFQEAVSAAWINLRTGRFQGDEEQFNAYIRQISKYKWLSYLQSAGKKRTVYADDVLRSADEPDPSVTGIEDQQEEHRLLTSSFSRLGEKCRRVLRLFYYEKYSLAEIAAETGDGEESLKTIKYRCMMQLRQIFLKEREKDE
ncbi:MAG: sigma-70 family RNA polymerase sigma factor [Mucilaginibacter polytrichastri]|nr:sigma-70 family RNA polymerase sigma factor [Mucilaginibacter polytrichastri]